MLASANSIDEAVDEDSDLDDADEEAGGGACGGGLSLPNTYGSQLSQTLLPSQGVEEDGDGPGPRLVAALRRAGQPVDCSVCGDDLTPPYAKCGCGGGTAMRAHLHCLALSFVTRAQDNAAAAGAGAAAAASDDAPGAWIPDGGQCPGCGTERTWTSWLRQTKYRFPLRRQSAEVSSQEIGLCL